MGQSLPNVIIIYPDQMRADAMSCAGNKRIKTPNIDRLACEGIRFTHAYTTFPLCCPFRASVMTGKYAHAHGMLANHYPIPLGQEFIAEIMRNAGYQTGYVGKWHLNGGKKNDLVPPGPERLGFEYFVGFSRGHNYMRSIYYRNTDQPYTSQRYEPDYQTDHLIEFMEQCRQDPAGRPFFGMICYGPPHVPMIAPPNWLNLYSPDEVPIRDNTPQDVEAQAKARRFLAKYYGLVANVDHNIGRILDWLDYRKLADNTIVILVSDHGDMAGEHGRYGKKTYYEAAMHVPFLVRYPRRFSGGRSISALVDPAVDIMPGILELCDIPIPTAVQGVSFVPLLSGDVAATRSEIFYQIPMEKEGPERFPIPERGIRTHEWLYVRTPDAAVALFDLVNDPLEMHNLVNEPAQATKQQELDDRLTAIMTQLGDRWDYEAVFPPVDFQSHEDAPAWHAELLTRAVVE
ncbi:MAG: sulfatase [Limnochordia bacterium]